MKVPTAGRALLAGAAAFAAVASAAEPPSSERSRQALKLCNRSDDAAAAERTKLIEQSIALAEQALAENHGDALAHFAIFCAVGRQAELAKANPLNLWKVRRLRAEIDKTLKLAPDFPGALLGKGALLFNLPWLMGGDRAEAEELIRRALVIDPDYAEARLMLARVLAARGRRQDADVEATAAVRAAEHEGDAALAEEARQFAAELAR